MLADITIRNTDYLTLVKRKSNGIGDAIAELLGAKEMHMFCGYIYSKKKFPFKKFQQIIYKVLRVLTCLNTEFNINF